MKIVSKADRIRQLKMIRDTPSGQTDALYKGIYFSGPDQPFLKDPTGIKLVPFKVQN